VSKLLDRIADYITNGRLSGFFLYLTIVIVLTLLVFGVIAIVYAATS